MKNENRYHNWHTGKCIIKSQKMKILCCLMLIVLMIGLFVVHCLLWDYTTVITDVSQYGHYDGTAVDDFVTDYINTFSRTKSRITSPTSITFTKHSAMTLTPSRHILNLR